MLEQLQLLHNSSKPQLQKKPKSPRLIIKIITKILLTSLLKVMLHQKIKKICNPQPLMLKLRKMTNNKLSMINNKNLFNQKKTKQLKVLPAKMKGTKMSRVHRLTQLPLRMKNSLKVILNTMVRRRNVDILFSRRFSRRRSRSSKESRTGLGACRTQSCK